jgi:geranylgeranyl diphosphate synthase type I
MNLNDFVRYRRKIDAELRTFLKQRRHSHLDLFTKFVLEELDSFILRDGKRLRPILVLLGHSICSKTDSIPKNIFKAAISIELLHDFLLVHDDIIDESDLRRGSPTLHRLVEKDLDSGRRGKLGKDIALIAGDILFSYSFSAIEESVKEGKKKKEIFKIFNKAITETCIGEIQDIFLSSKSINDVSESTVDRFNSVKTTYYTIEAPLKIGAIMADASAKQLEDIEAISKPLGQAFQLKDDLIGLFGDEKEIGKSVTSDVAEGKKTLPIVVAYRKASKAEKDFIRNCLGKNSIGKDDFTKLKKLVERLGAKDYSYKKLSGLVDKGNTKIRKSGFSQEHKRILLQLSDKWFR